MNKIALITGATSGIGACTAKKMAGEGYNLILTGRREKRLTELKKEINEYHPVSIQTLSFDIQSKEETDQAIDQLSESWKNIDLLINNAGLAAGLDPIQDGNIDDWEQMIDTNIKGLLYITKKIVPFMIKKQQGHIINIGSIAGKEVYAKGNVYCATKHAVEALTKAMRIDLLADHIKVTSIAPGNVETEFSKVRFKGDEEKARQVYDGYTPLYAEDIADCIAFAASRPAHVNINDMLVMSTAQANTSHLLRNE